MRYEVKSFLVFTFVVLTTFFFYCMGQQLFTRKRNKQFYTKYFSKTDILKESASSSETANVKNESINYVQKNNLVKIKR